MAKIGRVRAWSIVLGAVLVVTVAACQVPGGGTPPTTTTTTTTKAVPFLTVTAPATTVPLDCGATPTLPLTCTGSASVTVTNTGTAATSGGLTFDAIPGATHDTGCDASLPALTGTCTTVFSLSEGFAAAPYTHTLTVKAGADGVSGSDTFDAAAQVAVLQVALGTGGSGSLFGFTVGPGCSVISNNRVCVWNYKDAVVKNIGNVASGTIAYAKTGDISLGKSPLPCTAALAPGAQCAILKTTVIPATSTTPETTVTTGPIVLKVPAPNPYSTSGTVTASSPGAVSGSDTYSVSG